MSVILLHLITLAMLFIATMEKVVNRVWLLLFIWISVSSWTVDCASFFLSSPGGSGAVWITQTCGTTAGLTTSQEHGCVRPPKKLVKQTKTNQKNNFHKTQVTPEFEDVFFFFQSGFRRCRSWWSSPWFSPRSPFWCSWASCSPCPREDSSTSLDCVKSSQVSEECNNVLLNPLQRDCLKISCCCFQ